MESLKLLLTKFRTFWQNHWKKILIVVVILLLTGGLIWRKSNSSQEELTFESPQIRSIRQTIDVSGVVDAKERVRLRFLAGGKLTYVGAEEGDEISKWQTIATIDQATLNKQRQRDMNNYLKERWDWEQTRDDYVENGFGEDEPAPELSTRRGVDQAQWDLDNEVLDLEISNIAIKNTRLSSPIKGILTKSPTAIAGMQLLSTDYFEVVNPETMVFKAAVDEVDIQEVFKGQVAEIELDAFPDEIIQTVADYVAFASSQGTNGTVFVIELPLNQLSVSQAIRLGMNGDATIIIDEKEDILTIPIDATRERDGKLSVDVRISDQEYEEREIETGLESDDYIEIISGLDKSDEVLIPT